MHAGLSQPLRGKACLHMQPLLGPDLWHREVTTDLAREAVGISVVAALPSPPRSGDYTTENEHVLHA